MGVFQYFSNWWQMLSVGGVKCEVIIVELDSTGNSICGEYLICDGEVMYSDHLSSSDKLRAFPEGENKK